MEALDPGQIGRYWARCIVCQFTRSITPDYRQRLLRKGRLYCCRFCIAKGDEPNPPPEPMPVHLNQDNARFCAMCRTYRPLTADWWPVTRWGTFVDTIKCNEHLRKDPVPNHDHMDEYLATTKPSWHHAGSRGWS
jgi:hypothetical protein